MTARKRKYFTQPSTLETSVLLYLPGAIIMSANVVRKPEQIRPDQKYLEYLLEAKPDKNMSNEGLEA